jgi:hypothetical protein
VKLAIVAVYMVSEEHEGLLDVHLDRVRRHTSVPYTVYGSVNRLLPRFRRTLERRGVRTYELPSTDLRGAAEHSHYLEHLVRAALDDGATHVVTLHADSFPVRDGWAEELAGRLSGRHAFVTTEAVSSACLLFPRAFHRLYRPSFLLSGDVERTVEYAKFTQQTTAFMHSGTGFGFAAHQAGLSWYSMRRTATAEDYPGGPAIYDDLVFHLQGASRLSKDAPWALGPGVLGARANRLLALLLAALLAATPAPARRLVRTMLKRPGRWWFDQPARRWATAEMPLAMERLLADPDRYIDQMRANGR